MNASAVAQFSLCTSETPFLPISSVDPAHPGTAQVLVKMVAEKLGVTVNNVATPWKRCQVLVEQGIYDAMSITGYAGINPTIAIFPMQNGAPDKTKSLGSVPSVIYRRLGDKADFVDGKIINTAKPVAILAGRQVNMDAIKRAGANSEDGAKNVEALAQKLIARQADLAASAETEFATLVATRLKGVLEALPTPLIESHYYLVFSKQYFAHHQTEVESFWNEMSKVKNSPEYLGKINR